MSIEVMRQALEVLERADKDDFWREQRDAIIALRAAIEHYDQTSLELCKECGWKAVIPGEGCLTCARQKAKPVWIPRTHLESAQREPSMCRVEPTNRLPDFVPLYTAPRQWVELTDEEVHEGFCHVEYETPNDWNTDPDDWCQQFARYLEAKLKEKNHG
jgi:hypothetical protein